MSFIPVPLRVTCHTCGKWVTTFNGIDPDSALECECCPIKHAHAGKGCRTVDIRGTARLSMFDINDLMNALPEVPTELPEGIVIV
jgi:hypothetical protein